MCTEIEAKLKVDSLPEVEQKLIELGARFLAERLQTDYHFDDAGATFARTDRCFRLRCQKDKENERFFLTYKGAREKSKFKKRQEIEIEVRDPHSARNLLSSLGYQEALVVEKTRRVWLLGDCEVDLDHLPLLGDFVEIEGPDEEKIAAVQKNLGLSSLPHIPKSYASMINEKLHECGKNR